MVLMTSYAKPPIVVHNWRNIGLKDLTKLTLSLLHEISTESLR